MQEAVCLFPCTCALNTPCPSPAQLFGEGGGDQGGVGQVFKQSAILTPCCFITQRGGIG